MKITDLTAYPLHITEALFAGAAYKNIHTGEIYGPDGTHASVLWGASGGDADEEARLFDMYDNGDLVAGFLTTDHRFMTRLEAGKYVEMERDERRRQLDTDDPEFQNNVDSSMWESVEHILERQMVGAAYKDTKTGKIYGPAITHGTIQNDNEELKHDFDYNTLGFDKFYDRLGSMMDAGRIVDGFLTDDGEFMSRQDAAKAVRLQQQKAELGHRHGTKRDWLDSGDLTYLDRSIHERTGVPQATGKTLYHGTTVEIAQNAMQHGLYPSVGEFVRNFYGDDDGGGLDNLVFAADKAGMHKAVNAMEFHVGKKLGVSPHQLTDKQLYQNGAILVIRSGMDTNDSLYHRSNDDHMDYDDHPTQVEPGDYYGYEAVDPDYMLTGIKLKRFLTRLGLAQDNKSILHTPQRKNLLIRQGDLKKPVREDTEKDLETSQFLSQLVRAFRKGVSQHLNSPMFNAEDHFFTNKGELQASFNGEDFGFPDEFKDLWIVLRGDKTQPTAGFHSFNHPDGEVERVISFAVLPKRTDGMSSQDQLDVGLRKLAGEPWSDYMLHELVHVTQEMRGIPMNSKGNYVDGKKPSKTDYFNSPIEFDAYYQQLTHGYHTLLSLLRKNPEKGMEVAGRIGYRTDFETALESMLPSDPTKPEWGIRFYGTLKQNRKLIKRLYALHQAILQEMQKLQESETPIRQADDDHQTALDQTGFWGNAGAGCLIMAADTRRILLPKRSQWVQEPGTWGTWGGAIDKGEDPQEAALREVEEEAGYSGGVQKMIHLFRFQSGEFRYDTFLAIVASEFEPNLNWETEEANWFELGSFPKPLHFGLAAVLKDPSAQNKLGSATSL
jgi:8-oxo-dGTP pyrophosphatase MutT (NUDIX family)